MRKPTNGTSRLALLSSAGLASALMLTSPGLAQETTQLDVLMPNERTTTFYGMFVAQELGCFEEKGLDVNWLSSATTVPYVAFLANEDADLVMLDAPQTYQAVDNGQPVAVVYEDMQYAPESIYVAADSDIQDLSQLKGETVGLASDRDRMTVQVALDSVGLTMDDVDTAVVGEAGPILANAFRNNTVAAVAAGATEMNTIQAAGVQVRNITPPEVSQNPANSFVVWKPRLDELRPALEDFLNCWSQGMAAGSVDQEAVAAMMKEAVPEQWEEVEEGMKLLDLTANKLHKPLTEKRGDLQPDVWARVQGPYVEMGEISQELDPASFLDASLIDAANDWEEQELAAELKAWKAENPELVEAVQQ